MPKKIGSFDSGKVDFLNLFGVGFLVVSLITVTAITSNPVKTQLIKTFAANGDAWKIELGCRGSGCVHAPAGDKSVEEKQNAEQVFRNDNPTTYTATAVIDGVTQHLSNEQQISILTSFASKANPTAEEIANAKSICTSTGGSGCDGNLRDFAISNLDTFYADNDELSKIDETYKAEVAQQQAQEQQSGGSGATTTDQGLTLNQISGNTSGGNVFTSTAPLLNPVTTKTTTSSQTSQSPLTLNNLITQTSPTLTDTGTSNVFTSFSQVALTDQLLTQQLQVEKLKQEAAKIPIPVSTDQAPQTQTASNIFTQLYSAYKERINSPETQATLPGLGTYGLGGGGAAVPITPLSILTSDNPQDRINYLYGTAYSMGAGGLFAGTIITGGTLAPIVAEIGLPATILYAGGAITSSLPAWTIPATVIIPTTYVGFKQARACSTLLWGDGSFDSQECQEVNNEAIQFAAGLQGQLIGEADQAWVKAVAENRTVAQAARVANEATALASANIIAAELVAPTKTLTTTDMLFAPQVNEIPTGKLFGNIILADAKNTANVLVEEQSALAKNTLSNLQDDASSFFNGIKENGAESTGLDILDAISGPQLTNQTENSASKLNTIINSDTSTAKLLNVGGEALTPEQQNLISQLNPKPNEVNLLSNWWKTNIVDGDGVLLPKLFGPKSPSIASEPFTNVVVNEKDLILPPANVDFTPKTLVNAATNKNLQAGLTEIRETATANGIVLRSFDEMPESLASLVPDNIPYFIDDTAGQTILYVRGEQSASELAGEVAVGLNVRYGPEFPLDNIPADYVGNINLASDLVPETKISTSVEQIAKEFEVLDAKTKATLILKQQDDLEATLRTLKESQTTDSLTGILSEDGIKFGLNVDTKLANRTEKPLSVVKVGLDGFKKVNDTINHEFGDQVLIKTAELIQEEIRGGVDMAARIKGNNYLLAMPETSEAEANAIMRRVINKIDDLKLTSAADDPVRYINIEYKVEPWNPNQTVDDYLIKYKAEIFEKRRKVANESFFANLGENIQNGFNKYIYNDGVPFPGIFNSSLEVPLPVKTGVNIPRPIPQSYEVRLSELEKSLELIDAKSQAEIRYRLEEDLVKAIDDLRISQTIDPLTGALSKQGTKLALEIETKTAERMNRPFTVTSIDLNNFKSINIDEGWLFGNDVIKETVAFLKTKLRAGDQIGRIGGDEIIILFTDTDEITAKIIMDRALEDLKVLKQGASPDSPISFSSISYGAKEWQPGDEIETFLTVIENEMKLNKQIVKAAGQLVITPQPVSLSPIRVIFNQSVVVLADKRVLAATPVIGLTAVGVNYIVENWNSISQTLAADFSLNGDRIQIGIQRFFGSINPIINTSLENCRQLGEINSASFFYAYSKDNRECELIPKDSSIDNSQTITPTQTATVVPPTTTQPATPEILKTNDKVIPNEVEPAKGNYISYIDADGTQAKYHTIIVPLSLASFNIDSPMIRETTLDFLTKSGSDVAINGDGYEYFLFQPDPVNNPGLKFYRSQGFTMVDGQAFTSHPSSEQSLYFDANGKIILDKNAQGVYTLPSYNENNLPANVVSAISFPKKLVDGGERTEIKAKDDAQLNSRTALGITNDGQLILLTVDGNQTDGGAGITGMSIKDVQDVMVQLGAVVAVNFDGGGSTRMAGLDENGNAVVLGTSNENNKQANHLGITIGQ